MNENKNKEKFKHLRGLYLISTVGIQLVVSIFIGLGIGVYLDNKFNTSPIFIFIFLLFGIAAGFINLFRVSRNSGKNKYAE